MTVKELIKALEQIENKDMEIGASYEDRYGTRHGKITEVYEGHADPYDKNTRKIMLINLWGDC